MPHARRAGSVIPSTSSTIAPAVAEGFAYRRQPEAGWREALAQLAPPSTQVSYLWLDWLPGEDYEPVQRWAIWEVIPADLLERMIAGQRIRGVPEADILLAAVRQDLMGPSPRDKDRGHWHRDPRMRGGKRWVSDSLVNLQQWELWQELRGFATLFWIIQGTKGGHKRNFNAQETARLKMMGYSGRAPQPGDLPYAPFDNRTIEAIRKLDRLIRWEGDVKKRVMSLDRAASITQAEQARTKADFEVEIDAWLRDQAMEALDEISAARLANILAHLPVADEPDRPVLIRGGI